MRSPAAITVRGLSLDPDTAVWGLGPGSSYFAPSRSRTHTRTHEVLHTPTHGALVYAYVRTTPATTDRSSLPRQFCEQRWASLAQNLVGPIVAAQSGVVQLLSQVQGFIIILSLMLSRR